MSGRILIAEAEAGERILLRARLSSGAYEVLQAATADELIQTARLADPGVIVLPARLGPVDGPSLCRQLRDLPETRSLPILLRLDRADPRSRMQALTAGADAVVDPGTDPAVLNARIRNLVRRHAARAEMAEAMRTPGFAEPSSQFAPRNAATFAPVGRIVLVVPDAAPAEDWRAALRKGLRGDLAIVPERGALAALRRGAPPDAVVVVENPAMPECALRLVSELRCNPTTLRSAILLVQSEPGWDRAVMALDIGVDDLVEIGFDAPEVALRLRRALALKAHEDRCRAALRDGARLAVTDPLTGLHNRRYAMARLETMAAEAHRGGPSLAVMALDLDRFKAINDTYGHPAGDAILTEIARRMGQCLRQGDLLARIGGEEFLAAVRGCTPDQAHRAADRIRRTVCAAPVPLPDGGRVPVTVSIGLALAGAGPADPESLIARADRALYAAKADGRNQVNVCPQAA